MNYQMQIDTKNTVIKFFAILLISIFSFSNVLAQEEAEAEEATAASLYNDGLALLKEKNYVEGYNLMKQALEKGTEDENEQVIRLASKNGAVAAYSAGNTMLKDKDYEKAMEYYKSGTEMNPEYSSNFIGIGKVYDKQNEKDKKIDEAYTRAKLVVGKLFAAKEYALAVEAGNLFTAQQDEAEVYYYVSRCQTETGDAEGALASADKAIEIGKVNESIEDKFYVAKGLALESLNRVDDAVAAYKMVNEGDYKEQAEYKIQKLSGGR